VRSSSIKGHIDRCLRCGMTVSEHNPAAAAAPPPLPFVWVKNTAGGDASKWRHW
jgi:hypothetical protein